MAGRPLHAVEQATIVMAKQLKGAPEKAVPIGDYAAMVWARRASAMRLRATQSTLPVALSGMSSSTTPTLLVQTVRVAEQWYEGSSGFRPAHSRHLFAVRLAFWVRLPRTRLKSDTIWQSRLDNAGSDRWTRLIAAV
jgi:hypothetical protein